MKTLIAFLFILWTGSTSAQVTESWVRENCPSCYRTSDGAFLYIVNGKIIKYSVRPYGPRENLKSDRLEIIWHGVSDRSGRILSREATFQTAGERNQFTGKFRRLCKLFKDYDYYESGIEFTQGDHFAPPDLPTSGYIKQTCYKEAPAGRNNYVSRGVRSLVNFLSGSDKAKPGLNVNDELRGARRDPATGSNRSNSGNTGSRK